MQSGAPLTLECPACGHAFMALQSQPDTVVSCAHCAYSAVLAHFAIASTPAAFSQARRVQTQRRIPKGLASEPAAQGGVPAAPAAQPAPGTGDLSNDRDRGTGAQKHGAVNMHWPGLGTVELEGQRPVAPTSFGPPIEPVKKSTWPQWLLAILLILVCAGTTALLIKEQLQSRRDAAAAVQPSNVAQPGPMPAVSAVEKPRDFVDDRVHRTRSAEAAERLLKMLFEGTTIEEKIASVPPDTDREQFAAFFSPERPGGPPGLIAMKELQHQPIRLPSLERCTMFSVMTTRNQTGCLLRLTPGPDGRERIDWPLFQETHDHALTSYTDTPGVAPAWFHVGFRKVHAFQLPESEREIYDAIDVDGSTDGSSHLVSYVPVNSPVGRYLASQMEWGSLYLGRLLLAWTEIGGQRHLTILDCEGANITGRELPAAPAEKK
jgi:hypothetical protein